MKNNILKFTVHCLGAGIFSGNVIALNLENKENTDTQETTQQITEQVFFQLNRQISSTVSNRISYNVNPYFDAFINIKAQGAGDDDLSLTPDSLWGTFSWSKLQNDGKAISSFNTDIYQTISGVDKKFGDFYIGASLIYAAAITRGNSASDKHIVNVTPYLAYMFNDNYFLSALTGYSYTNTDPLTEVESNSHSSISELAFNSLHIIDDSWFMKGKIGGRYNHTYTKAETISNQKSSTDNTDSWTFLTDVSGGYIFENQIRVFTGILYELNNKGADMNLIAGNNNYSGDNSVFYYNAGIDYSVTKALSMGATVQTDLSNSAVDLTTVGLNMRLAM